VSDARRDALEDIVRLARAHGLGIDDIRAAFVAGEKARPESRASGVVARVLAYLGGVLVLAGIALFVGMQWDQFTPAARVLVTLGAGFAVFLFALATLSDPRFSGATTPMLLVAVTLQPTGLLVLLDEYARGADPEHGLLLMGLVMFLQQFLVFLACRRTTMLFAALFFGAAAFGTACDLLDVDFEVIGLALGIALLAVSWVVDRGPNRAITPFWYFAGAGFFLAGAFDMLEGSVLEVAFFGVAAGVMYLGTVARSRTLLFVSVIALTSFTGWYFRDSLANAFGLIVLGLLLIGLSAFAMSLNRRYIRASGASPN